jgi:hypothetical protein
LAAAGKVAVDLGKKERIDFYAQVVYNGIQS